MISNLSQLHRKHAQLLEAHDRMCTNALTIGGTEAIHRVKLHKFKAPSPSGGVRDKTEFRIVRTARGKLIKIRNTAKHAMPLDKGARAHIIKAKPGGMLAFMGRSGEMVFRHQVNHPGNKPTRFLKLAANHGFVETGHELNREIRSIARRFR